MQAFEPISYDVLKLDKIIEEKVPGTYKQSIRVNGNKLFLQSMYHRTEDGIPLISYGGDRFTITIPMDSWIRQNLSVIERFIQNNVQIPNDVPRCANGSYSFKTLLNKLNLQILLSKWCKFLTYDPNKMCYIAVDFNHFLQHNAKGEFSVKIECAHVYIGPHKNGHQYSLSLRAHQVVFKEDEK